MSDRKNVEQVVALQELPDLLPCVTRSMALRWAVEGKGSVCPEEFTVPNHRGPIGPGKPPLQLYVVDAYRRAATEGNYLLECRPGQREYVTKEGHWVPVPSLVGNPFARETIEEHVTCRRVGNEMFALKDENDAIAKARGYTFNAAAGRWVKPLAPVGSATTPPEFQTAEEFAKEHDVRPQLVRLCAKSARPMKCRNKDCRGNTGRRRSGGHVFDAGGASPVVCPRCGSSDVVAYVPPLVALLGRPIEDKWDTRTVFVKSLRQPRERSLHVFRRADGVKLREMIDAKRIAHPKGKVRLDALAVKFSLCYPTLLYHAQRGRFAAEKAVDFKDDGTLGEVWFASELRVKAWAEVEKNIGDRQAFTYRGEEWYLEREAAAIIAKTESRRTKDDPLKVLRGIRAALRSFRNKPCPRWGNIKVEAVQYDPAKRDATQKDVRPHRSKWATPWIYRAAHVKAVRQHVHDEPRPATSDDVKNIRYDVADAKVEILDQGRRHHRRQGKKLDAVGADAKAARDTADNLFSHLEQKATAAAQAAASPVGDPNLPAMAFIDPATGKHTDFGDRAALWELWRVLWLRRPHRLSYDELRELVPTWKGGMQTDEAILRARARLQSFWLEHGRKDLAQKIRRGAGTLWFDEHPAATSKKS